MPELKKYSTIKKNVATGDDLDYTFLRKKGLEYIEHLASGIWTDFNAHDPGITILEMLSYALTDLANRIELPMENLLAPEDKTASKIGDQFFAASKIFPSKAVSEADYRKLFIDIEGVKNCWLKPYTKTVWVDCKNSRLSYNAKDFGIIHNDFKKHFDLQGLYTLVVDFDDLDKDKFETEESRIAEKNRIKDEIRTRFHASRNLCEDLVTIEEVQTHPIAVCAAIELEPEADEELVHAKVIHAIDTYFSPSLKFYSLKQMVDKGYTSAEIFEGPLLENGFLDPKELEASGLRTEVRLSDIMQLIMAIGGVKVIKDISVKDCKKPGDNSDSWLICVEQGKKPVRCKDSAYSYYKSVLPVNVNQNKVDAYLRQLKEEEKEAQELAKAGMEFEIPEGVYSGAGETTTIQNDFPDTYGIGRNGLPSRVKTARKSQAKQLKGYLLFFDQVLASYFAHLAKIKDLLSIDNTLNYTYFTQAVQDLKDFRELVSDYPADDPEMLTQKLLGDLDNNVERKNKLLDHMLARFAEKITDYAFLMKQLYGSYADKAILQSKQSFLKDYDVTSRERGSAFNYYRQPAEMLWNTENVAGVQKRIARLVGIKDFSRRDLSGSFIEIYDLVDSDGIKVYRWRVRDHKGKIILTATENYSTPQVAQAEMYRTMIRVLETSPEKIEDIFFSEEGMFLVEHILLRPDVTKEDVPRDHFMNICKDDCDGCHPVDPYSFRVTVVLPGWTYRFADIDFRNYLEDLIRKELPAHVLARICWIGYRKGQVPDDKNDMLRFEKAYKSFLFSRTSLGQEQDADKLKELMKAMNELNSVYPTGKLIDCDDEDENLEGRIILGRTNIGNI